jgi:hypothetical protein
MPVVSHTGSPRLTGLRRPYGRVRHGSRTTAMREIGSWHVPPPAIGSASMRQPLLTHFQGAMTDRQVDAKLAWHTRRAHPAALSAVSLLVGLCVVPVAGSSTQQDLPLSGTTARGHDWRLQAAKPEAGDDVAGTWCLKLRYTTGIIVNGNRFGGGLKTCGRQPPPRVSGMAVIDCERGSVFVFGAARATAKRVRVRDRDRRRVKPDFASLPARSGFKGRAFIAVIDVRHLPVKLTASRAGQNPIVRIPERSEVCVPHPGAPEGGEPFVEFASSR